MGLVQRSEKILCPGVFFGEYEALRRPWSGCKSGVWRDLGGWLQTPNPNQFYHSVIVLFKMRILNKKKQKNSWLYISSEQKYISPHVFFPIKNHPSPPQWVNLPPFPPKQKNRWLGPTLHTPRVHPIPRASSRREPEPNRAANRVFFHPFFFNKMQRTHENSKKVVRSVLRNHVFSTWSFSCSNIIQ